MTSVELQDRLKKFASRIPPLCEALPNKKISKVIEDQLLRSAFSAAANYRAVCKGQSKKSFKPNLVLHLKKLTKLCFG